MAEAAAIEWHSASVMPNYAKRMKDPAWELKQQKHEYQVAARREKRLRKSDEKKQRKLNATILRRMTRNPEKYNKNAERNRVRACETERRRIRELAMEQVRQLAAKHDPTGEMFNIGPVVVTEDGKVRSEDAARRWRAKQAKRNTGDRGPDNESGTQLEAEPPITHGVHPERAAAYGLENGTRVEAKPNGLLQRPKPHIPEGITLPRAEENYLALWDITDAELEARIKRAKRRAAAQRKALRVAQQTGKLERRAARDEKRKVYKELKETWKTIKADDTKYRVALKSAEDREEKVIAVKIAAHDRRRATEICEALGCTIENTPGTGDIQPRLLGMKGQKVNFNDLEFGDDYMDIRFKSRKNTIQPIGKSSRANLSSIPQEAEFIAPAEGEDDVAGGQEFIQLDIGEGKEHQSLSLNHKLRKKIRRAVDRVQLQKELLVRSRVRSLLKEIGIEPPPELSTYGRPRHIKGHRVLESGLLETDKKERIRASVELAEFNKSIRVLRKQAKRLAMDSGLRVYAQKTGRIPETPKGKWDFGPGWKEPEVIDPRNLVRPEDLKLSRQNAVDAEGEMDDIYSWADEDEDLALDQSF